MIASYPVSCGKTRGKGIPFHLSYYTTARTKMQQEISTRLLRVLTKSYFCRVLHNFAFSPRFLPRFFASLCGRSYKLRESGHIFDTFRRYHEAAQASSKAQQRRHCGCPLGPFAHCWFFFFPWKRAAPLAACLFYLFIYTKRGGDLSLWPKSGSPHTPFRESQMGFYTKLK